VPMFFGFGLSQVILQKSLACAIIFAAALLACSPTVAIGALAGLVISTVTGMVLEKQKGKVVGHWDTLSSPLPNSGRSIVASNSGPLAA
jgi:hypothetical protein